MSNRTCTAEGGDFIDPNKKNIDIQLQLVLSLILGVLAFVTFCVRKDYPIHSRRERQLINS